MTHRRQNFMGGAAILAGAVAVTKLLGALYKIPLGNLLDREGMAHFYAAYNIYSLLLVLSTAGLPVALSRMVSRAAAQRRYGAVRRCLHLGLALLAALGLVCSAVMCLLPEALAAALHDPDAAPALRTLGPAVLLVCLSAALRGYSQGLGDMVPTAAGQVAESAGKLLIGLGLCLYLLRQGAGTDLCAAGAIGGVTAGAGLGLLVTALLLPRRAALPEVRDVPPASSRVLRELLRTGIPITVGAAGMSLITLLDQALVTATLRDTLGYTTAETTALYGEYTFGMTLFMLPPSFIYPLSVSLMPAVSAALTRRDRTAAGIADGAGGPARRRGTVGAGGAYPAAALSSSAGDRRGGGLSPDVPGSGLCVRMPDGGHQRRPTGLRSPAAAGDLPPLRRRTEDRHQLPDGGRSRHGHSGRSGEHTVLLRADRGHQPGSHRTAGAGASGVYLPVCQARSSDGGDGAGGPVRLWPVLPPSAREMGGTAGGAAGRRCIRGAGAGHRRRDAAGSSDPAERGKAG